MDCFVVVDGVAVNNILAMTSQNPFRYNPNDGGGYTPHDGQKTVSLHSLGQFFTHEKSTHSMPHTAKNQVLKIAKSMKKVR